MLFLGLKQLEPDPWLEVSKEIKKGNVVSGTITLIVNYGVFLNIKDNFTALLHYSEVSWGTKKCT